jgi:integrase
VHLPAKVTKTGKPRNVAITHPDAAAAALRLTAGLAGEYTKKRFESRWGLLKREYARNDDTFVFHVTRHNAASKMANELQVPTVIVAEALGHSSLATTQRYVHAKPDTLADIGSRM